MTAAPDLTGRAAAMTSPRATSSPRGTPSRVGTPSTRTNVGAAVQKVRRRRLRSQLLGDLLIDEDAILEFPDGLFGFASCTQWVLVNSGRPGWCWLHAMDHGALAFLLVDPFDAYPEFAVTLTPTDLAALDATSATEVGVFAIVTLPRTAADAMTVNLQGPVAIVASSRRGRQLVIGDARLGDGRFGARAPLSPQFAATFAATFGATSTATDSITAQVFSEHTDTEA